MSTTAIRRTAESFPVRGRATSRSPVGSTRAGRRHSAAATVLDQDRARRRILRIVPAAAATEIGQFDHRRRAPADAQETGRWLVGSGGRCCSWKSRCVSRWRQAARLRNKLEPDAGECRSRGRSRQRPGRTGDQEPERHVRTELAVGRAEPLRDSELVPRGRILARRRAEHVPRSSSEESRARNVAACAGRT